MLDISNYQAKGRPPYSSAMIRFALHLRYTSLQSYKLLEKFLLPSISTLHRIQAGGVDSLKAAKKLPEKGHISSDVILMVDEMFLQKEASYQSGDYVGEDEEGELYKGIACFMIVDLKQSVPHVIQAIPEVTIIGEWLAEKISTSLHSLAQTGFTVRGIVTDNHNSNVNAFKSLKQKFRKGDQLFEYDVKLQSNLKKAPKLSYQVLHPVNKIQSVPLALAIFHETTTAAFESFFPEREDASKFLKMINTWWLICNYKEMSHPNPLGNAVRVGNGKTDFLEALADWLEKWHDDCPAFTLKSKTSYALVLTLRAQSGLIKELLSEGYDFVMTSRLQSDPIERRFSQYSQMSGGRFLVSLWEVTNSERIIRCRSLVKADINFWKEDLGYDKPSLDFSALLALLSEHEIEIAESTLDSSSEEVSITIAGYIAKKLAKRSNCDSCKSLLIASSMDLAENHYLNLLSRGGLIVPSAKLAEYTSHCFAIIDYSYNIVQAHSVRDVRAAYNQIFD